MNQIFKNNASSRLVAPIDQLTTSIRVLPDEGVRFPQPAGSDFFMVTIEDRRTGQIEICRCVGRSLDILNVVRGQEGTNPQAFALGSTVSNRLTADTLNNYVGGNFTKVEADPLYVNVVGDVMTGPLQLKYSLGQNPDNQLEAVNKDYVDRRVVLGSAMSLYIGDSFPPGYPGMMAWESDTGNLFVWYDDGDSQQWVQVNHAPEVDPNTFVLKSGDTIIGHINFDDGTGANPKPHASPTGMLSIFGQQIRFWADLSENHDGDVDADMVSKANMYLVAGAGIHLIPSTNARLPWNADGTIKPGGTPGRVVIRGNEVANYIQSGGSYNTQEAPEKTITGITKAANAVFTVPAHGFSAGVTVGIQSIPSSSMREMNSKYGVIDIIDANSFRLGIDSTTFSTYTTGGVAINIGKEPWYKDLIITRYLSGAPWMIFDESEHGRCGIGRGFPKASEVVPNAPVNPVDLYQVAARLHVLEDDIAYELPGNPYYERVALFETKNPLRAKIELRNATAGVTWTTGAGSPEGVITATVGSLYSRTDGAANTSLYVKQSGTGNTGWAAK